MPQEIPHPQHIKEKLRTVKVLYFLAGIFVIITAIILFYIYVPLAACIAISVAIFALILVPAIDKTVIMVEELVKDNDCWENETINYRKMVGKMVNGIRERVPFK